MAKFLSYLFHPLFSPLLAAILIFNLPLYLNYKYKQEYFLYIYVIIFMNLILAPLLISFYLKRIQLVESLQMKKIKERQIPYLITSIFYAFTYYLLSKINFPSTYLVLYGAAAIAVIILFLFSLVRIKLSAHMTALGGICGMLIILSVQLAVDLSNWLIVCILISGLVGTSRLKLAAHNSIEVLFGFALGLGTQLILLS